MTLSSGVIYTYREEKLKTGERLKVFENLDGDSGVGQALEFPSRFSKNSPTSFFRLPKIFSPQSRPDFYGRLADVTHRNPAFTDYVKAVLGAAVLTLVALAFPRTVSHFTGDRTPTAVSAFGQMHRQAILEELSHAPDPAFSLVIPSLEISTKVAADVDMSDPQKYNEVLKEAVAQARGSKLPGEKGNVYIFGHSTDTPEKQKLYNAVFMRLPDLKSGDEIAVYFRGEKYVYRVEKTDIVAADDLSYLKGNDEEKLILQTCYPLGTREKRFIVIADRVRG